MAIDLAKFGHISFDLWLTLIKSNPDFKEKRSSLLIEHFDLKHELAFVNQTVRKFDILFNTINETTGGQIEMLEMWMFILNDLGCDANGLTLKNLGFFLDEADKLFLKYPPVLMDENTAQLFAMLRNKGITLSLLSNTGFIEGMFLRKLMKQLNLAEYFSFQLYSDEMGHSKPNPKVFKRLYANTLKIKDIPKTHILHIGDNEKNDVLGAKSFGISSILLNPGQKITQLFNQ